MKATFEFKELYKESIVMGTKVEIVSFFKEMKESVCKDLQNKACLMATLYEDRPIWEKIVVQVISSELQQTEKGYTYHAIFEVKGIHTRNCYDRIVVAIEDVDFLKKVTSIDDYLAIMFKLRYSGFLMTHDDLLQYEKVAKKPLENNRVICLCKIDEQAAKARETHSDKVKRLAIDLGRFVGKKPFEVCYGLGGLEQRILYTYDKKEHFLFLESLIDRTRTHDVLIRFVDNEISEWFRFYKGLVQTKLRKIQA